MTEYTFHKGVLRVKSDGPVRLERTVTLRREDRWTVSEEVCRPEELLKEARSGGFFYQWWRAPLLSARTVLSPAAEALLEELEGRRGSE